MQMPCLMAGTGATSRGKQLTKPKQASNSSHLPSSKTNQTNQKLLLAKPRVPVKGARKVWGTLKSTTVVAVTSAIRSATSIATKDLTVKR